MAEKKTFVVWAPTQSDPGVFERRIAVREEHLKHLGRITAQGILSAWWYPFTHSLPSSINRVGRADI